MNRARASGTNPGRPCMKRLCMAAMALRGLAHVPGKPTSVQAPNARQANQLRFFKMVSVFLPSS